MERLPSMNMPLMIATASLLLLLTACTKPADKAEKIEEQVNKELDQLDKAMAQDAQIERAAMTEDLRNLRIRVADELAAAERKLSAANLGAKDRAAWEAYRRELLVQRDRIDRNLSAMGLATRDTWNDVKREAESIKLDVEEWFKRQAEKVDRRTKADADKDGH